MVDSEHSYEHPYPAPDLAALHPFVPLETRRLPDDEMLERARAFQEAMGSRRSVRMFSSTPVPGELIERAVLAASTAPSGAHKQPRPLAAVS